MDFIGIAQLNHVLEHTKTWPGTVFTKDGILDLGEKYKRLLTDAQVHVIEIANDVEKTHLIYYSDENDTFIWQLHGKDIKLFLPIINKNGIIVDTTKPELSQILQQLWKSCKHGKSMETPE